MLAALRRFLRKPGVVVLPVRPAVVIGDDVEVTVRILTAKGPLTELTGGRLELHVWRTAPFMGPSGQLLVAGQRGLVATAPFDVPSRLPSRSRYELPARVSTAGLLLGPSMEGKMSGAEYDVEAVVEVARSGKSAGLAKVTLENPRTLYASAEQYRDTFGTPDTGELEITLSPPAAPCHGAVRGTVTVRPPADYGPVERVEVGIVRRLEFTEPTIPGLIREKEWTEAAEGIQLERPVAPGSSSQVPFVLEAPDHPTCYDGVRFNVRWLVFARVRRPGSPDVALRAELNVYSGPG